MRARRQPLQQPRKDPAQSFLAVLVRTVVERHHGDRDALATADEQRDLVVDSPRAGSPAALK